MKRRQFAARAAAAFAATAAAPWVFAQDRTVRILVGFPPGGSVDVVRACWPTRCACRSART